MTAADVTRKWIDAVNRQDAAGVAALYAPNALVRDPQYPEPLEGRDAVEHDIAEFFRALPDLNVELRSIIEADGTYAVEASFAGTHRGPLVTPGGEIPPTGKRVELAAAGFYRLDGQGRILEENRYFDLAGFLAQLEITL